MGMDRIAVTGMEFYGYHGVFSEEREKGQLFFVDLELFLSLRESGKSDEISDSVNYAEVYETVREIVEGAPMKLIESVAECIAQSILQGYEKVDSLIVTVHKPDAPIAGIFQDVSVRVERARV